MPSSSLSLKYLLNFIFINNVILQFNNSRINSVPLYLRDFLNFEKEYKTIVFF